MFRHFLAILMLPLVLMSSPATYAHSHSDGELTSAHPTRPHVHVGHGHSHGDDHEHHHHHHSCDNHCSTQAGMDAFGFQLPTENHESDAVYVDAVDYVGTSATAFEIDLTSWSFASLDLLADVVVASTVDATRVIDDVGFEDQTPLFVRHCALLI